MECNRDEAERAKAIAEKKLQTKDFQGARRMALRAQKLYADLENISQMLMVCEVHCSAEKKLPGTEMDWLGILQLERAANEATIRKQYQKFALQLHPDKNKFPGAESAFKLVGEAHRVLLDQEKQKIHEMKKNAPPSTAAYQDPASGSSNQNNRVENNVSGDAAGFNSQCPKAPPPQAEFPDCRATFWTMCPFCSRKFQYYKRVVNRALFCYKCRKVFVAYDLNVSGASPGINMDKPKFPEQDSLPKHGYPEVEGRKAAASAYDVNNRKRRREDGGSSGGIGSENSGEFEEDEKFMNDEGPFRANQCSAPVRTSSQQWQKVSDSFSHDDEDEVVVLSDEENGQPSDKEEKKNSLQEEAAFEGTRPHGYEKKAEKQKQNGGSDESSLDDDSWRDLSMETEGKPDSYDYPDPDFNDFDKDRQEGCISVGEIWAVYDSLEGMPRFVAQIRKVFSAGLKLKVTWLEPKPEKPDERKWVTENLPVSCGKFGPGKTEEINRSMLSHRICSEQVSQNMCIIYPNVGETWAILKNWDIKWYSDPDNHRRYDFEFVEILSEYNEKGGLQVAYLRKVKGFTSVFAQTCGDKSSSFRIRRGELYRFSHRVPSFRLTGEEREGVPRGCFELDPASIPLNIEEIDLSNNHAIVEENLAAEGKSSQGDEKVTQVCESETFSLPGSDRGELIEIPASDFHDFDDSKSKGNFQAGQVWALYSDEDCLPKNYCQITKIIPHPQFKLHIRPLTRCMLPSDVTGRKNEDMLNSSGKFKLKKGRSSVCTTTTAFSHQMKAKEHGEAGLFEIVPEKGDVWVLHRCWNLEMSCSATESCNYDLVEVIERNDSVVRVSVLEQVDGSVSVFKCQLLGSLKVMLEIPMAEILRFSHLVPAVQLAEESNGSLRGCWDIDTAACPFFQVPVKWAFHED